MRTSANEDLGTLAENNHLTCLLVGCWLVVGCLLVGCWLVVGWLLVGCWLVVCWLFVGW